MARILRRQLLRLCAAAAVLCAPLAAWSGPALDMKELRAKLRTFEADTAQTVAGPVDVPALRRDLGLADIDGSTAPAEQTITPAIQPAQPPLGGAGGLFSLQNGEVSAPLAAPTAPSSAHESGLPVDVGTTNFRLMLATLSQTYSGINNLSVITAQGPRGTTALSIRSGTVTLPEVRSFFAANGMPPRADGTLTAPLVLWPDATLVVTPGERLAMARDAGAFILSMGHLDIDGALIEAAGAENAYETNFVPFVTVLGGGSISLQGSTLRGLGFGRSVKFAGLSIARNPLMTASRDIVLRGNLFEGMKAVTIASVSGARVTGNTFTDARSNVLNLVSAPRTIVHENLFRGAAPTNAIRVDNGSNFTDVARNLFLGGARVAILVDGKSNNVAVRANLIWRRDGAGIKFLNTRCGLAEGNWLVDNRQKGIEVRKSDGAVVQDNLIAGNRSAGVWVSAQAETSQTTVRRNTFEANGAGLSAATGAEIWISGNDLTKQMPKLLDGDIARLTSSVVRDLRGEDTWQLNKGQAHVQENLISLCGGDT